jgi:hypothetical protein
MRDTTCSRLSECLGQISDFHRAVPLHEVVTLFVDLKDEFAAGHLPSDLDAAIAKGLGRENIVSPADMMSSCDGASSLRSAVTGRCHFPTVGELQGKFLIVTTGGAACEGRSLVSKYENNAPKERLAFIAPNVDDACPLESYDARSDVVFFNLAFSHHAAAQRIRGRGLVARVYGDGLVGGVNDADEMRTAFRAGATHVATDRVRSDVNPSWLAHGRAWDGTGVFPN